jgi:hypothetical protein
MTLKDVMKIPWQANVIDALNVRNRKLHHDDRDHACLKLKVGDSGLHSHLLAFAAALSWRAVCVVGKVAPSTFDRPRRFHGCER